jgi:hydroxymethylpyrimidine pyrophosphatase-like HAD family hydrolase
MNRQFPPPKVIAVDVDGTLYINGGANLKLIEWLKVKKEKGFRLMLWSARGESHARNAAETFGVADLFHTICSKPGYVVDDLGWSWIKHTKVIRSIAIEPET